MDLYTLCDFVIQAFPKQFLESFPNLVKASRIRFLNEKCYLYTGIYTPLTWDPSHVRVCRPECQIRCTCSKTILDYGDIVFDIGNLDWRILFHGKFLNQLSPRSDVYPKVGIEPYLNCFFSFTLKYLNLPPI